MTYLILPLFPNAQAILEDFQSNSDYHFEFEVQTKEVVLRRKEDMEFDGPAIREWLKEEIERIEQGIELP